jgi:uncharacterized membrane protein
MVQGFSDMHAAKFILSCFGIFGTVIFCILGILQGLFPAKLQKLRAVS